MITAMMCLLYTVIKYKPIVPFNPLIRHASNSSISSDEDDIISVGQQAEYKWYQRSFWAWDYFLDYVNCLLAYTTLISISYVFFHQHVKFIEALGFLSLGIESTLPVPQILTNFKHRNTDGFSWVILASWVIVISKKRVNYLTFFFLISSWVMALKHSISFIHNLLFSSSFVLLFSFALILLLSDKLLYFLLLP